MTVMQLVPAFNVHFACAVVILLRTSSSSRRLCNKDTSFYMAACRTDANGSVTVLEKDFGDNQCQDSFHNWTMNKVRAVMKYRACTSMYSIDADTC